MKSKISTEVLYIYINITKKPNKNKTTKTELANGSKGIADNKTCSRKADDSKHNAQTYCDNDHLIP